MTHDEEIRKALVASICSELKTPPHLTRTIKKALPYCSIEELQELNEELDIYIQQLNKERRERKARILDEAKRLLLEEHDQIYRPKSPLV